MPSKDGKIFDNIVYIGLGVNGLQPFTYFLCTSRSFNPQTLP